MEQSKTWDTSGARAFRAGSAAPPAYWLAAAAIFVGAVILCLAVADSPILISRTMNADLLLPVAYFWDLQNHPAALNTFQLPRIPSLFPDIAVFGALDISLREFRWAILGYAMFQCGAFVCAGGLIVSRAARVPFVHSAALFLALLDVILLVDLRFEPIGAHLGVFTMVEHFGAFLLSLVALLLVLSLLRVWRAWVAVLLTVCCGLGFLSNRIFMFDFIIPLALSLAIFLRLDHASRDRAIALGLSVAVGAAIGAGADLLLTHAPHLTIEQPFSHMLAFLRETPGYLGSVSTSAWISLAIPYFVVMAYPPVALVRAPDHARVDRVTALIWTFAALAILATLALCAALYIDAGSYRYLSVPLFWPLILIGVAAMRVDGTWTTHAAWGRLLGLSVILVMPLYHRDFMPRLLSWRDPLGTCLLQQRDSLGLKAGLAEYWRARPATIGANWTIQVDQITADGNPYHWGNDPSWFEHSTADRGRAPKYNFIVVDRLDSDALLRRYGRPAHTDRCGAFALWVYAKPLNDALMGRAKSAD